jgi:hypothetical protein
LKGRISHPNGRNFTGLLISPYAAFLTGRLRVSARPPLFPAKNRLAGVPTCTIVKSGNNFDPLPLHLNDYLGVV